MSASRATSSVPSPIEESQNADLCPMQVFVGPLVRGRSTSPCRMYFEVCFLETSEQVIVILRASLAVDFVCRTMSSWALSSHDCENWSLALNEGEKFVIALSEFDF